METFYTYVTELNMLLYSFIGCFLAIMVFYFLVQYNEKGISPLMVFRGHRFFFLKQIHAKIQELLLEGSTTEDVKITIRNVRFPFFVANPPCANDNVDFVRSVLANDEFLEQYLFQLQFTYSDYRRLVSCFSEDRRKVKGSRAVQLILNDESSQNVEKLIPILVDVHTKPFVFKKQLGITIPAGRNEMAVFQALSDMKILKKTCTPQQFGTTMLALMEQHPSMDVLKGRSTIYYHADKITSADKEFKEITAINRQYIEEKIK